MMMGFDENKALKVAYECGGDFNIAIDKLTIWIIKMK